ncbi:flagellin [Photobacterium ganghwense]|uniref:flagellin n=1 Tax=Photobacterium ganghwense TaxID=320778 RepID=UPI00405709DD
MAVTINTNVSAMNAQRNLSAANNSVSSSMERLSTGLRINSAKDDAAGLQISNRLTNQSNGLTVAMRNANDGISMAQTAEGAMQESTNIMQRMRDLALQSSNGSNSSSDREAIQKEVDQLQSELNRIADTTSFGGQNLLDGSYGTQEFQIGSNSNETQSLKLNDMSAHKLGRTYESFTAGQQAKVTAAAPGASGGVQVKVGENTETIEVTRDMTAEDLQNKINNISGLSDVSVIQAADKSDAVAATMNLDGFTAGTSDKSILTINDKDISLKDASDVSGLIDAINNADAGVTATDDGGTGITLTATDTSSSIKVGIDVTGTAALTVNGTDYDTAGTNAATGIQQTDATAAVKGDFIVDFSGAKVDKGLDVEVDSVAIGKAAGTTTESVASIDVSTVAGAQNAVDILDAALADVDSQRADLGSFQNRMNHTINNLANINENVTASNSRIKDVDFAKETTEMTKSQILQQASTSILAQAKMNPQAALSLLG